MVMIRPRGGDFCYTPTEFEVMRIDIRTAKAMGADGVVFGLLMPDGAVDTARTAQLVKEASPMLVTFHRAFDMTSDPLQALEDIISIGGIQRVLTSGQDSSVLDGLPLLKQLVQVAGDRIQILPGGGVTPRNLARILGELRVPEIHMALPKSIASDMVFRNPNVFMGVAITTPEYSRSITDGDSVASVVKYIAL
ncbi:CutC family-domain-containing protein [Entophlyctis helioformis]|nr:CutC family-domain-containing protein [Entophlyctis helioformis]